MKPAEYDLVLLGAGASMDAGLPSSFSLVDEVSKQLKESLKTKTLYPAFEFVRSSLLAFKASKGDSPQINIEELFQSVSALADSSSNPLHPFVASWVPTLEALKSPQDASMELNRFVLELHDLFEDFESAERFERGVNEDVIDSFHELLEVQKSSFTSTFKNLSSHIIDGAQFVLSEITKSTDYLAPIVAAPNKPVNVVTLNYDLVVEKFAKENNLRVDRGESNWEYLSSWDWDPNAEIHLLKLHGSLDWAFQSERGSGLIPQQKLVQRTAGKRQSPGLIFGEQNKLTARGPFLRMYLEFVRQLEQSDSVLIVGYSLGDPHVNVALEQWLAKGGRRLTVVDPGVVLSKTSKGWTYPRRGPLAPRSAKKLSNRLEQIQLGAAGGLAKLAAR